MKSRKEKVFDQWPPRMGRGACMASRNPGFRTQIIKVDPHWRWRTRSHGAFKRLRQTAGKGFNDDIARNNSEKIALPAANLNAMRRLRFQLWVNFRTDVLKRSQFIDP